MKNEFVKEWGKSLGLAFVLFLIIRAFLVQAFKIPTGSMESTLLVGDFLLVNKMVYGASTPRKLPFVDVSLPNFRLPAVEDPQRGDIVVFEYPKDRSLDFVKRCMAVGGDTVEMRDKVLYVNHVPLEEPYTQHTDPYIQRKEERARAFNSNEFDWQYDYLTEARRNELQGVYEPTRDNFGPLWVPEGKYFCLGDNRDSSLDSRYWGFVDRNLMKGRPMIVYFSWDKRRWFPRFGRMGRIVH